MFNSTHTFVGISLARSGLDDWVPKAALTAVIAANLPDVDIVTWLSGTPSYLEYHRGITHSFFAIPFFALVLSAVMYLVSENFWRTFVVALAAMYTHPLLDYANTYGLRPFLPWDGTWYYGDTLPIIDPYLDSILLIGILAGSTFQSAKRLIAWLSLGLAVLYIGARVELRNLASSQVETLAARNPGTERWGVSPDIFNPLVWNGIIQSNKQVIKVSVDPLDEMMTEVMKIKTTTPSEIPKQAFQSETGKSFMAFARFPVMKLQGMESGYRILLFDFRFYDEGTNTSLGTEIMLDRSYQVTKETFSFQKTIE
jgi:membrane-bound metal-dependent hydrolase YbcI (DUF457 family)